VLLLQLCNDWALGGKGGIKKVKGDMWGMSTVVLSFLDWPLRRWVLQWADTNINLSVLDACMCAFSVQGVGCVRCIACGQSGGARLPGRARVQAGIAMGKNQYVHTVCFGE
jgi:hypothetical protein